MKTLAFLLVALVISGGVASAQSTGGGSRNNPAMPGLVAADVNGFHSPTTLGPVQSSKMPNLHPNLKPQLGGVFVDGVTKYGTQLINPAAPASYGMGEKYLSAPDPRYDLMHESGPAAHHDAGGIKLFSFEF